MFWVWLKETAAGMALSKDALHIYVGFAIQLTAAALLRQRLADWIPWLTVLVAELVNEALDIWFGEERQVQPWQLDGAQHDILNTLALPTAIMLLCRYAPHLFAGQPNSGSLQKAPHREY